MSMTAEQAAAQFLDKLFPHCNIHTVLLTTGLIVTYREAQNYLIHCGLRYQPIRARWGNAMSIAMANSEFLRIDAGEYKVTDLLETIQTHMETLLDG